MFRDRKVLREAVEAFLQGLGANEKDIAGRLESEGVRGRMGDRHSCVVACYLSSVLGADHRISAISVSARQVEVFQPRGTFVTVKTPEALRAFLGSFDCGSYPALVREAEQPDYAPLPPAA